MKITDLVGSENAFGNGLPREPFVSVGTGAWVSELFNIHTIQDLLNTNLLRPPAIELVADGKPIAVSQYTWAGEAGPVRAIGTAACPKRVLAFVQNGATLILNMVPWFVPKIAALVWDLGNELSMPVRANAFLTPPGRQGFKYHYDTDSVFVVQIQGSKRWQLMKPYLAWPLEPQHFNREAVPVQWLKRMASGDCDMDVTLREGDVLWVPRGWLHNPFSEGERSLHLTLGVQESSYHWLAAEILALLVDSEEFRRDLPVGFAHTDGQLADAITVALERGRDAIQDVGLDVLVRRIREQNRQRFLSPDLGVTLEPSSVAEGLRS